MKELRDKNVAAADNKKQVQLTFRAAPAALMASPAPAAPLPMASPAPAAALMASPAPAAALMASPAPAAAHPVASMMRQSHLWTANPGGKVVGNTAAVKSILGWSSSCLLLQGPCGSGKSALAKAAIKKRGLTIIDVRDSQEQSDASLKDTLDVLCFQNETGMALFMDELETLLPADRRMFLQWLRKIPLSLVVIITVGEEDYRQTKALGAALPDGALNLKLPRSSMSDLTALADAIQLVNCIVPVMDKAHVESSARRSNGDRRKFINMLQWLHTTSRVKGVSQGDVYDTFNSAFGAAQQVLSGKLSGIEDCVFIDKFLSPMLLFENYPRVCDDLAVTSAALSDAIAMNYTTPQVAAYLANHTVAHCSRGTFSYPSFPKGMANTKGRDLAMRQVARRTGIDDVLLLDVGLPVVTRGVAKGKAMTALAKKLGVIPSDLAPFKRF